MMHRSNFKQHRFFIGGGFLERINQMAQILDGINIMMRRRRNGVGAFRNHPGFGNVADDLALWQMPADAGFCALPHLNLMAAPASNNPYVRRNGRSDLNDGIGAITCKILVQPALAGIIIGSHHLRRARQLSCAL
jgi:hypothetical protein